MDKPVSDPDVIAVLRPFVRASGPLLAGLGEPDPFGLRERVRTGEERLERPLRDRVLDALAVDEGPGSETWAEQGTRERCTWWLHRVGRFTTLLASVPGEGGAPVERPLRSTVGAAGPGLLLCALAAEFGVTDERRIVALLGAVLFNRELQLDSRTAGAEDAAVDAEASALTGELTEPHLTPTLDRVAHAVRQLGQRLLALEGELERWPRGRWYHQLVSRLPLVGVFGDYLGAWYGLRRACRRGVELLSPERRA